MTGAGEPRLIVHLNPLRLDIVNRRLRGVLPRVVCISLCSIVAACGSSQTGDTILRDSRVGASTNSNAPLRRTQESRASDGVIALVNGQPIRMDQILPALKEAAGAQAIEDAALDLVLAEDARRAGITITDAEIAAERTLFLESIYDAGLAGPNQSAEEVLLNVRRARGLGPVRFNALLKRSATLRALVSQDVLVTDEMIALAWEIEHGEKRGARIIATATLADAQRAIDDMRAGTDFSEVAVRRSTDVSAARGGIVEPISPLDPTYPQAVRTALTRLEPGESSPPLVVDNGYAIVQLTEIIPADGVTLNDSRTMIRRRVRLQEERRRMSELAERLRRRAQVTILDPALQFQNSSR